MTTQCDHGHLYDDPESCPACTAILRTADGNQCDHGQLARTCLLCEMRDEIEALRAQVAQHEANANRALAVRLALLVKLADCQAVIRGRGHDDGCPASSSACAICGLHELLHPCVTYFGDSQNHNFNRGLCSDACGHDRTTEEKA